MRGNHPICPTFIIFSILFFLSVMASALFSLDQKIGKAKALLPPAHCLPPQEGEGFASWEEGKARLQDYAFTQGFAIVIESFQKTRGVMLLECTRHHRKERNTRKLAETDRQRKSTKVSFNNCKYRVRLRKKKDEI